VATLKRACSAAGAWLMMLITCVMGAASAQSPSPQWPSKPVTIVVPFTPGGGGDSLTRMLSQPLMEALGQTIIVDNKPGAGGSIGAKFVAAATPDGYTLLNGTSSTHGINPWLYARLGYDVLKDFEPITVLAISDYALGVPMNSPARSVSDLLAMHKTNKLMYASSGNGTTSHLASALFANLSQSDFQHVPYKSSGPALQDLIGGQISFFFDNTSVLMPQAKAGKLRILATSGASRSAATPDVPTMAESGVPQYDVIGWWALFAPANTPKPVIERLHKEVSKVLESPAIRQKIVAMGNIVAPPMSPAEAKAFVKSEYEKFGTIVKMAGVKLD
jgi:tripartite-type tricarboxylate transporter receptor subunit TctC